jgi:hypothetical protein
MTARRLHRITGLVMLLPFLGWAITGAIFFLKPGYGGAYDTLAVKTYPIDTSVAIPANPAWLEARYLKTILGEHLLVRTAAGWQHLDARSVQELPAPAEPAMRQLLDDALSSNPARYGRVTSIAGNVATTDTGVRVTISWPRLVLAQRGTDTDRIDAIYRIHYLQWTGIQSVDRVLGAAGLTLIVVLSLLGARLWIRGERAH